MDTRAIPFERIDNFRDYGRYAVPGGGRLRDGWLYRSAHYGDATVADLQKFIELGIKGVIDLRGQASACGRRT